MNVQNLNKPQTNNSNNHFNNQIYLAAGIKLLSLINENVKAAGLFFPNTIVIAGGAIRDAILGKPIKDIDIFVPSCSREMDIEIRQQVWNLRGMFGIQFPVAISDLIQRAEKYAWNVRKIADLEAFGVPVQVMTYRYKVGSLPLIYSDLLKQFDLSICKVAADATTLYPAREFGLTLTTKLIKYEREKDSTNGDHVRRIRKKYPEYNIREI